MKKAILLIVALIILVLGCVGGPGPQGNQTKPEEKPVQQAVVKGEIVVSVQAPDGSPVGGAHLTITHGKKNVFDKDIYEVQHVKDLPASEEPYLVSVTCPEGYEGTKKEQVIISNKTPVQVEVVCNPLETGAKMDLVVRVLDHFGKTYENGTIELYSRDGSLLYKGPSGVVTVKDLSEADAPYKLKLDCGENRKDVGIPKEVDFDPFGKTVEVKCIPSIPVELIGNQSAIPSWALVEVTVTVKPEKKVKGNITFKATASVNKSVYEYVNVTEKKTAKLKIIPSDYTWPHLKYQLGIYCGERYNVTLYNTYLYGGERIKLNCSLYKRPIKVQFKKDQSSSLLSKWVVYFKHSVDGSKTFRYDPPWYSRFYEINMTPGWAWVYGYGTTSDGEKYYCQAWNVSLPRVGYDPVPSTIIFNCVPSDKIEYHVTAVGADNNPLDNVAITLRKFTGYEKTYYTNETGEVTFSLSPADYYYTRVWATCGKENASQVYYGGVGGGQNVLPQEMRFSFQKYSVGCP